jgi:MoaA/NifB/PqqE/SkfB family radical SAM enzyme
MQATRIRAEMATELHRTVEPTLQVLASGDEPRDDAVRAIITRLMPFLAVKDDSSFSYERYLLLNMTPYLRAFVAGKSYPPFEVEVQVSSRCNFACGWCIGAEVQCNQEVIRLPNQITEQNIDRLVDGLVNCRINGLGIQLVKFSGAIGEPLVVRSATLRAIRRLSDAGLRVGLFTNGFFMDESTWDILVEIDYVHISLDGGPLTFSLLKEPVDQRCCRSFERVVANIAGLAEARRNHPDTGTVRINVGYVMVPENVPEIYEASRIVRDAGADSIRFKCDIGGKYNLVKTGMLSKACAQIDKVRRDFHAPPEFVVRAIHSKDDIEHTEYQTWNCERGCLFQNFFSTVASDGNLYLCDHNTMPSGTPLGHVINDSFQRVWESKRRRFLKSGVRHICRSNVCPPFANRANVFLAAIRALTRRYGVQCMQRALDHLVGDLVSADGSSR